MNKKADAYDKAKEILTRYLSAQENPKMGLFVTGRSRSGMQKSMRVYVIHENALHDMTWYVASLCGHRTNKRSDLIMRGCGYAPEDYIREELSYFLGFPVSVQKEYHV